MGPRREYGRVAGGLFGERPAHGGFSDCRVPLGTFQKRGVVEIHRVRIFRADWFWKSRWKVWASVWILPPPYNSYVGPLFRVSRDQRDPERVTA